jgi:hypothetical protein
MEDGLSAYICVICGWFLRCRNAARSVRTCTPAVSQCCAVCAHVRACRIAMLHRRRARAHLRCRNAARSAHTCTPAVSQCCASGAHVHTFGVATLRGRRTRAHLRCRNAARSVRTCTPAVSQCCAVGAHVHTCRVATLHVWCADVRTRGGSVTCACVRAAPLEISAQPAYVPRYNFDDRKIFDVGGCRRYGRAG